MGTRYPTIDRSRLRLKPLGDREHDLEISQWPQLADPSPEFKHPQLPSLAAQIWQAKERGASRNLMMGAHLLRSGANRYLNDLLERGAISHIAMNGAGAIKTMLVQTVADGGRSYYFCGSHKQTFPALWNALLDRVPTPTTEVPAR